MLPLGLGIPGEEMELEEMLEEAHKPSRPGGLKIEEAGELGGATEKQEKIQAQTFKIGGHEVVEELREGEDVSYLKCVKCGLTVRLDEAGKLSEARCVTAEAVIERVPEPAVKPEVNTCGYCGKTAVGSYPVECVGNNLIDIPLCKDCMKKLEETYMNARPNIMGLSRKSRVRCRHPLENSRAIAWQHYTATWYVASEDGGWPCPACGTVFERLLDAVKHFSEKHPELPSRSGREYVAGIGEVSKTWQGYYCPVCGLLCNDEKTLRGHYKTHGGV